MHPGNLRILRAVHPPSGSVLAALLEGRGEIAIFDTVSRRNELDRMSGGDFDGDLVTVCWDSSLMPSGDRPCPEPPNYSAPEAEELRRTGTLSGDSVAVMERLRLPLVGMCYDAFYFIAGFGGSSTSASALRLAEIYNWSLDAVKSCYAADFDEVEALLQEYGGRKFSWNFMRIGESPRASANSLVRVSATAAGRIAEMAQKFIDSLQLSPAVRCRQPDPRLLLPQISPSQAAAIWDCWQLWRARAQEAMLCQRHRGRRAPTKRPDSCAAEEVADAADAPTQPYQIYLCGLRGAVLAAAASVSVSASDAALYLVNRVARTAARPLWASLGDLLVEAAVSEERRAGRDVISVPAAKLWLLGLPSNL